ncbi:MAG: diguanylate cyclase [Gammaproteobacteria bacterium]|nr:diguanylate cyclase [Gammaproteobacteria bacterium]
MTGLSPSIAQSRWLLPASGTLLLQGLLSLHADAFASGALFLVLATMAGAVHVLLKRAQRPLANLLARTGILLLALATLAGHYGLAHWLDTWVYAIPLGILLVWPLRTAYLLLLGWLLGLMWIPTPADMASHHLQQLPGALMATALAGVFVWLRDYRARQLAPLRRTDTLTLGSTLEHLNSDLRKEIQRSEREGTDLAVILLQLSPLTDSRPSSEAEASALLHRVGRLLHEQLRDFDSYYRLSDARFLLILPGSNTAYATRTADKLRRELRELLRHYDPPRLATLGLASLNVGDDAESLQTKAEQALQRASQQGGNRAHSFSDADNAHDGGGLA